jgi:hypothetical protein
MSLKRIAVKVATIGLVAAGGAALLTGTAQAETPAPPTSITAAALPQQVGDFPLSDPHGRGFRAHFRTRRECVFFANHDRNPRTHGWDCRRGGDRNFPWEYWY